MLRFFHVARTLGDLEVLVDVNLNVESGELVVVSGSAGAGKSTLVRLLLGLEVPRRGWITVDGLVLDGSVPRAMSAHRRRIAAIPQGALLVPDRSALENVALALDTAGYAAGESARIASQTLERLGLDHLAARRADCLSSGERQWVAIARGFARGDANLLVADEPAAGLGTKDAAFLGDLFRDASARGKTVLVTTRDPGSSGLDGARCVRLEEGRIREDGSSTTIRRQAS